MCRGDCMHSIHKQLSSFPFILCVGDHSMMVEGLVLSLASMQILTKQTFLTLASCAILDHNWVV